jgi:hypothetical protein
MNATTSVATLSLFTNALPPSNVALIGGIVGGVVALLVVVGLIAFLLTRSRRRSRNVEPNPNTAVNTDVAVSSHRSIYESFSLSKQDKDNYENGDVTKFG